MVNSTIFTIAFACVIAIVVGTVNDQKTNIEVASKEKTETMQEKEEQNSLKALTTVTARTPNANNFTYVTSLDGQQVPVPKGYVASTDAEERYVNGVTTDGVREHHGGFVIYEKNAGETDEQATATIVANLDTAKTSRNQWVWVPIGSTEVNNMYHITNGQIYGNYYTFSSSNYSIRKTEAREPIISKSDIDHTHLKQYMEGISQSEFLQKMREEFHEMLESVKTYGGFYVGRYETGNINQKEICVVKENSNITNVQWYKMYARCKNLKGSAPVKTGLIWMIQWHETLKWLIDTGEKTTSQVASDSTSWGNYQNSTVSGHGILRPTGYSDVWKANNIYDLAGNAWELCMGTTTPGTKYRFAGGIGYVGSNYPASKTGNFSQETADGTVGCRATLCLLCQ